MTDRKYALKDCIPPPLTPNDIQEMAARLMRLEDDHLRKKGRKSDLRLRLELAEARISELEDKIKAPGWRWDSDENNSAGIRATVEAPGSRRQVQMDR